MKNIFFIITPFFILLYGCSNPENQTENAHKETVSLSYEIRRTLEHDTEAFTQGLVYFEGKLIESTGGNDSWIAEYDLESGNYDKKLVLDQQYFGEGITVLNNKVYQLTWKSNIGFIYDARTYVKLGEFSYDFEGWGITHDHRHLIISDGTDRLRYFDTLRMTEVLTKSVTNNSRKASKLNELEFIDGFIYANQWESNLILKIDTSTSTVVKEIDLSTLARENKKLNPQADVLNGIAYNPETKEVFITGKLWPRLHVLRLKGN